jgi:hypothetical protein
MILIVLPSYRAMTVRSLSAHLLVLVPDSDSDSVTIAQTKAQTMLEFLYCLINGTFNKVLCWLYSPLAVMLIYVRWILTLKHVSVTEALNLAPTLRHARLVGVTTDWTGCDMEVADIQRGYSHRYCSGTRSCSDIDGVSVAERHFQKEESPPEAFRLSLQCFERLAFSNHR